MDDIILIVEIRGRVNVEAKVWRQTLESKGSTMNARPRHKFNNVTHDADVEVRLDTQVIQKRDSFKYSESIVQENVEVNKDITHRIGAGWRKRRIAFEILCDKKVPHELKGKFY